MNGVFYDPDDPVNDVHHSVGRHLVPMNDPGAVHCHHLIINTE